MGGFSLPKPLSNAVCLLRHALLTAVEKKTLLQEPPLAKNCKHIFNIATAAIATEQVNFKVKDIVSICILQSLEPAMSCICVSR